MPVHYNDEDHYKIEIALREGLDRINKTLIAAAFALVFPLVGGVVWFVVNNEVYSNSVELTRQEHMEIIERLEKLEDR